jgi:hypothetical protein
LAHLHNFRRLRILYERHSEIHTELLALACSILCWATPQLIVKRFLGSLVPSTRYRLYGPAWMCAAHRAGLWPW